MSFKKQCQADRSVFQRFVSDPLVAFVVTLLWFFFKVLPVRTASAVGDILGWGIGYVACSKNKIALHNLAVAFPNKSVAEHRVILRKMWRHWGRFFAEMPHAQKLLSLSQVQGVENLDEMREDGKGGFIFSAHLGNWEMISQLMLQHGMDAALVYRAANNPYLEKLMFRKRAGTLIPKGLEGARQMIQVLRNRGHIALLVDQKLNEGIEVPFLGKPAMTAAAMATLALKMKVPVYMGKSIRQPNGRFLITIYPALKMPAETDMEKATQIIMTQVNQIMSDWIYENPEQWLWIHRRFDKKEYR